MPQNQSYFLALYGHVQPPIHPPREPTPPVQVPDVHQQDCKGEKVAKLLLRELGLCIIMQDDFNTEALEAKKKRNI